MLSELYDLEGGYEMRGLRAEDIETEQLGIRTKEIVRSIRIRLGEELRKDNEIRSSYMMQTLKYLDYFCNGLWMEFIQ